MLVSRRAPFWIGLSLVLLALSTGIVADAKGQQTNFTFGVRLSYGVESYDMGDLPAWQQAQLDAIRSDLNVPAKVVDAFPAQFALRGDILIYETSSLRAGLTLGYNSTGGRVHYADYSGSLRFDQVASRIYGGGYLGTRLSGGDSRVSLWATGRLLISSSTVTAKTVIDVEDARQANTVELTAPGVGFLPTLAVEWDVWLVSMRLYGGYELSMGGRLKTADQERLLSSIGEIQDPTLSWSGGRVGLSVGFGLSKMIHVLKDPPENTGTGEGNE